MYYKYKKIYFKMDLFFTILVSAAIIVFGFGLVYLISYVLRRYSYFTHSAQFFISILSFLIILSFTYVAFGDEAVAYLMNGLFIGVGLALQPMFKTVTKGFVFDGTHLSKYKGEIEIHGKDVRGRVHNVGMMHTWIEDKDGSLYMISNDTMNQSIVKVHVPLKNTNAPVYQNKQIDLEQIPLLKKPVVTVPVRKKGF